MNRSDARTFLRGILGVDADDQLYTDARLNVLLEQAHHSIVDRIREANPRYLTKTDTVTLVGSEATLPSDFSATLEVRITDSTGVELNEVLYDDLSNITSNNFGITGEDSSATIRAAPGVVSPTATLWIRYTYWPAAWTTDVDPPGVPAAFHEVVALEAVLTAFEFGNESEIPKFIANRHRERFAALLEHVRKRGYGGTTHIDYVSRLGMRQLVRGWLGLEDTDPQLTDGRLNLLLIQAHHALIEDIQDANPSYFTDTTTLTALSDNVYTLPVAGYKTANGFARALEVRYTDAEGSELTETRADQLKSSGQGMYAIVQPPDAAPPTSTVTLQLHTSQSTDSTIDLWLRYVYYPRDFDEEYENTTPDGIPHHFVDVLALEALQLTGANANPALRERWIDRRAQLISRVGRLSKDPMRQRLVKPFDADQIW